MRKRIYVSNLPFSIEEEALEGAIREILSALGTVESIRLIFEGTTLRPKGLCFAEMGSEDEARLAVTTLNGLHVAGKTLYANEATPRLVPDDACDCGAWDSVFGEEATVGDWPVDNDCLA